MGHLSRGQTVPIGNLRKQFPSSSHTGPSCDQLFLTSTPAAVTWELLSIAKLGS
jgi:hypothetical protein